MTRPKFCYIVEIEMDEVPGWNNKPEDFQSYLQRHLNNTIDHYKPKVYIAERASETAWKALDGMVLE